ncbi:hypothetical protein AB0I00_25890 [Streptomyces sp. NPDC050803]|uniref:hypothetical protein n=1 Tax=unclassified Streptomyces TaxID=2593676 RepID=UPI00343F57E8
MNPAPEPDTAPDTSDTGDSPAAVPEPRTPEGETPRARVSLWGRRSVAGLAVAASLASIYPVLSPAVEGLVSAVVSDEAPARPRTTVEGVPEGGHAVMCQHVYGEFDAPPPDDHAYWIFVRDKRHEVYFTQERLRFDPMDRRRWEAVMWVGDRSPAFVGRQFVIYVVMVPIAESRPREWTGKGVKFPQLHTGWTPIADLPVTRGPDNTEC